MAKILTEALADLESGIAKSLGGGRLDQAELEELEKITIHEMMVDHGLDSLMAERILLHAQSERYRLEAQRQYTPTVVDDEFQSVRGLTRSHPISENRLRARIRKILSRGNLAELE